MKLTELLRALGLPSPSDYLLYDVFAGAPGSPAGRAPQIGPLGGAWVVTGPAYASVRMGGGALTQVNDFAAGYTWIDLDAVPSEIGCTFEFLGVGTPPTIACYANDFLQDMLHANCGVDGGGNAGIGTTIFLAGAQLLLPQWSSVYTANAAFTVGHVYTYRVIVDGRFVVATVQGADGTVLCQQVTVDDRVPRVVGSRVFFETFDAKMVYRSVWARAATPNTPVRYRVNGGLESTPIGMMEPAPGKFDELIVEKKGPFAAVCRLSTNVGGNQFSAMLRLNNDLSFELVDVFGNASLKKRLNGTFSLRDIPVYTDNTAAKAGGLVAGDLYRTASGALMLVF